MLQKNKRDGKKHFSIAPKELSDIRGDLPKPKN